MKHKERKKDSIEGNGRFNSTLGFILACVGSAVGLGNIWMFPYRLGQYGGAAFLIPYLLFVLLFGYVGLSGEFALGRYSGTGLLGSYKLCWKDRRFGKAGSAVGWIPLFGALGIAIGYGIIIGWVLRSLWGSISGDIFAGGSTSYFSQATGQFGSIGWHFAVIIITAVILVAGKVAGIEKINKILIPIFFCLFTVLAVRVSMLDGAIEGYKFLFLPKWEYLFKIETWIMAMGQAFFSLSIIGAGMITYGSYLEKKEDVLKASIRTAVFDTIAALLSALAIMPAVFAFGIEPSKGPSLMFLIIPEIFKKMPLSRLMGVIFFASVLFAGVTSLMNMFESFIESIQFRFKMNRKLAVVMCAVICMAVGVFIEDEASVGSFMDIVTIFVVPFGAVYGAFSIYYALGNGKIKEEIDTGRKKKTGKGFIAVARYIYVPLTVLVFILGIIYKGIG